MTQSIVGAIWMHKHT